MLENANILDVSRTAARPHYEQAHRFYHTWDHIAQMFDVAARDALPLTLAQQLAIVWHDAVYVPGLDKGANERASALLMRDHMDRAGWLAHADGRTLADTVEGIIVSTIDHVPQLAEAELVLDLDLYRLGVDFDAFQQHADAVRQEYGPLIRARGNADEGSDVDILVILQGPTSEFIESEATADLVAGLSLEYDTIVCCMFLSEEDYRERDMAFYCVVRQESRSV